MNIGLTIFRIQHSYRFKWFRNALNHLKFGLQFAICVWTALHVYSIIQAQQTAAKEHLELAQCRSSAQSVAETINTLRRDKVKWGIICSQ